MAFRSGWPGSFQLEPLDRYADTERERAGFLVGSAVAERQRRLAAQAANTVTARVGNMQLAPVPIAPQPKGGGGLWNKVKSGVDAITPDALESPAKTGLMGTLSALDAGRKYVGAPIGGVLSGRLGAEQQTAADGSTFRETGALWEGGEAANLGRGLKKLFTQDPRDTYKESQQAWEEGQRDPAMSAGKRVAGDVAIDPLTWATPGAVGAGLKLLPAGMAASKPARFAGNILSSPTRASVGGLVGSSLAAEGASRTGIPELPATLVGGLAGGIGAGARGLARSATPPPVLNRQQLGVQNWSSQVPAPTGGLGPIAPPRTPLSKALDDAFDAARDENGLPQMTAEELRNTYYRLATNRKPGSILGPARHSLDDMRIGFEEGIKGSNWYRTFSQWAEQGVPVSLDEFMHVFAITSAQAPPAENLRKTFDVIAAINRLTRGGTQPLVRDDLMAEVAPSALHRERTRTPSNPKGESLPFPGSTGLTGSQVDAIVAGYDNGTYSTGGAAAKTPSYNQNLSAALAGLYSSNVTADTHHASYFGVEKPREAGKADRGIVNSAGANQPEEYDFMWRVTEQIAREYGVTPYAAQAAMWDTMKRVKENPAVAKAFSRGEITWKEAAERVRGETSTGEFEHSFNTDPKVKDAYEKMKQSFTQFAPPNNRQIEYAYGGPGTKGATPSGELRVNNAHALMERRNVEARSPYLSVSTKPGGIGRELGLPKQLKNHQATLDEIGYDPGIQQVRALSDAGIVHTVELPKGRGTWDGPEYNMRIRLPGANEERARWVAAALAKKLDAIGKGQDAIAITFPDAASKPMTGYALPAPAGGWTDTAFSKIERDLYKWAKKRGIGSGFGLEDGENGALWFNNFEGSSDFDALLKQALTDTGYDPNALSAIERNSILLERDSYDSTYTARQQYQDPNGDVERWVNTNPASVGVNPGGAGVPQSNSAGGNAGTGVGSLGQGVLHGPGTPDSSGRVTPPVQGYVSDDQVRAAWETDVRAANPGVEPADLDQYISGATPDDWSHMRPSLEKAERAQGLAKTPYRENINRIEPDASNIARGRGPLINRLQTERGRGLDPAAIDAAQWFVRNLPEKYTARLASSFVKGTGYEAQAGQYIAKNADEEDGLIRIIKAVTNKQPDPERVIVHEVGHHLEQFVPDEDYRALRSQWEREMGTNHGIMPGSGQGGQKIVDAVDDMVARQPAGKPFDPDAVAGGGGEAYRYTGGFGEWFAENIADRALRDFDQAAEAAGPWQRAWQAIRDIAEGVYRYLLQRGEKDAAERVYRNIMQGKYGESFRTGERTIPQSQGYNTAAPPAGLPLAGVSAVSPPAGGPTSPPAGGKSPRPRIDMFDVIGRKSRLREEDAFNRSLRGKADRGIRTLAAQAGGEKLDKNLKGSDAKTFIVKEKNRIDTQISSYEAKADDLFMGLKNAGLEVEADAKGTLRTPNGTAFEDLLERRTRASRAEFAALPKEQQDAIRALDEWNERLNANLRFHKNSDLGWDESGKLYFPRVSVGVDGKKRAFIENGGGRAMGRTQGFSKERTFEDVFEDGLQAGIDYGDPRNAWRIMTRAKLRAAEDAALANRLKPMGVTKKNIPNGERIGVDWIAVGRDVAPALSGRYFPPDVVQTITSALVPQNSFHAKVITEFNKKATPLRAMADLSFLLQQGSAMIFHPRHAVKVPKATIDVIRSTKDRAVYDRMIKDVGMDLDEAIKHGLVWGADDIAANDFHLGKLDTIGGRIASKPGVKQAAGAFNKVADFSNQTYGRYMNYVRANFVKDAQERLAKMKPGMAPDEWRKEYQGAMNAINRLSGTTGRKVSSIESMGLFAPRYFSASVEQLNAAVTRGGLEGSIARAHLGRMLAFGAAMVIGSNELRGKETELDPRSSNFLRFRDVGGLDVSPFGTYDTLFRAIAGTAAGDPGKPIKPDYMKLWKLAEGKMSPGFKLVYEPFVRKGTYSGEPLDPTTPGGLVNIAKQQGLGSLPFSVQNAVTSGIQPAIEERSLEPLKDAIPGILASGGGATNSPVTPTEKRNLRTEKLAQEKYGKSFEELSGTEKSIINEDAEVKKHQAEADRNIDTLEDDRSINRRASIEREAEIEALTRRLDNKEIPGSEFRKNYRDIQMQARGAREVLEQRKGDKEIEAYFKVFDDAEREDGSTDYEKLDELLPAFVATHPGIEDKVNRIIGTKDNATMREFRVAQSQAREFYALPQYEGLSVEDGKKAAPILAFARRLVANNQAPGYREAIGMMLRNGDISKEDGLLALRAQKAGTSRARKQFKADHAEYRKFYSDEVLDEDYAAANTYGDEPAKLKTGSGGFSLSVTGGKKRSLSLAPIG